MNKKIYWTLRYILQCYSFAMESRGANSDRDTSSSEEYSVVTKHKKYKEKPRYTTQKYVPQENKKIVGGSKGKSTYVGKNFNKESLGIPIEKQERSYTKNINNVKHAVRNVRNVIGKYMQESYESDDDMIKNIDKVMEFLDEDSQILFTLENQADTTTNLRCGIILEALCCLHASIEIIRGFTNKCKAKNIKCMDRDGFSYIQHVCWASDNYCRNESCRTLVRFFLDEFGENPFEINKNNETCFSSALAALENSKPKISRKDYDDIIDELNILTPDYAETLVMWIFNKMSIDNPMGNSRFKDAIKMLVEQQPLIVAKHIIVFLDRTNAQTNPKIVATFAKKNIDAFLYICQQVFVKEDLVKFIKEFNDNILDICTTKLKYSFQPRHAWALIGYTCGMSNIEKLASKISEMLDTVEDKEIVLNLSLCCMYGITIKSDPKDFLNILISKTTKYFNDVSGSMAYQFNDLCSLQTQTQTQTTKQLITQTKSTVSSTQGNEDKSNNEEDFVKPKKLEIWICDGIEKIDMIHEEFIEYINENNITIDNYHKVIEYILIKIIKSSMVTTNTMHESLISNATKFTKLFENVQNSCKKIFGFGNTETNKTYTKNIIRNIVADENFIFQYDDLLEDFPKGRSDVLEFLKLMSS